MAAVSSVLFISSSRGLVKAVLGARVLALVCALIKQWAHLIFILITLEARILAAFFLVALAAYEVHSPCPLFLLSSFIVIGASLGVSLMARLARSHGNDFILLL